MGTVRMLARCELRRRGRGTVAIALLVGAVGAVVLASAAGARRSDTALDRFNAYSRTSDLEISVGTPSAEQLDTFRRSPGVAALARIHGYALIVGAYPNLAIGVPADGAMGDVVDRARLIRGRFADPRAPDEVTIGERLAAELHLRIGSELDTTSYTQDQILIGFRGGNPGPPRGPNLRLRVVGIVRRPLDLGVREATGGVVLLTPAFNAKYGHRVGLYTDTLRVKTRAGAADVPRVIATAHRMFGKEVTFQVQPLGVETEGARNAIDVLTLTLWILAAVTALAGAVAVGIVLTRDVGRATVEQSMLRAVGATRGQAVAARMARVGLIAGGGALLAGLGAIAASRMFPVGVARRADPDVGLHADWLVLGLGITLVAAIVLATGFMAAGRATRTITADRAARARGRTSPVVELAARAGLRPTATNGLRMALQGGRGESTVPVRSGFAAAIFGVAGITAVLVFAASLTHLVGTPKLVGWTWNLRAEVPTSADRRAVCVDGDDHGLARSRGVAAVSAVCVQSVEIDGRPVSAWGFDTLHGSDAPVVVEGRAPNAPGEVALGSVTLHAAHKHIGDTVEAHVQRGTRKYVIVGRMVLPSLADAQPLADGAVFTVSGIRPILVKGENETHFLLARFTSGADGAAIRRQLARDKFVTGVATRADTPVEVGRLQQIDAFPAVLAGLLAILALVAAGHTLVTSVRRRRRELALFKTVGFRRRQVAATIAWHATTLAVVGLVVGIPIGLVVGRAVWGAVADGLGVQTVTIVPAVGLGLLAAASVVLFNVIAFVPGRLGARTRPAVALRAE